MFVNSFRKISLLLISLCLLMPGGLLQTQYVHADTEEVHEITDKEIGYVALNDHGGSLPLRSWEDPTAFGFDVRARSIGADLGAVRRIVKVELWNWSKSAATKQREEDYEVYASDDNAAYRQIKDWTFQSEVRNGRIVHTVMFGDGVDARFIKFHSLHTGETVSFVIEKPDGLKVFVTGEPIFEPMNKMLGYVLLNDTGGGKPLQPWDASTATALDYRGRSVGAGFASARHIVKVELWNQSKFTSTRQTEDKYEVYASDDNLTYRLITDWSFQSDVRNNRIVHTFKFDEGVDAKFIKFHSLYTDDAFTFGIEKADGIRIFVMGDPDEPVEPEPEPGEGGAVEINSKTGYVAIGDDGSLPLGSWSVTGGFGLDYMLRSVGADVGSIRNISKVELWSNSMSTRQTKENYEVYVSDSNSSYRLITDWTFRSGTKNNRLVHTFEFEEGVDARYVKIHSLFNDAAFTFGINKLQKDVRVFINRVPDDSDPVTESASKNGFLLNDSSPVTGTVSDWGQTAALSLDVNGTSAALDIGNGKKLGRIELKDSDASSRVLRSDYEIYASSDNTTYTMVNYWIFTKRVADGRLVHTFDFPGGLDAKYVKIKTDYTGTTGATFILSNPQTDMKAFRIPSDITPVSAEIPASMTAGYTDHDMSPTSGAIGNWGVTSAVYADESLRSIGVDLGEIKQAYAVQWRDADGDSRLTETDYTLYASKDNISYEQLPNVEFRAFTIDGRLYHRVELAPQSAFRYLKIRQPYNDNAGTYKLLDPQQDIMVFTERLSSRLDMNAGYIEADMNPESGALANWGTMSSIMLDEQKRSVGIDLQHIRAIGALQLKSVNGSTRLSRDDYLVYQSDDNISFTSVENWSLSEAYESGGVDHTFRFTGLQTRYLKIATAYNDSVGTFRITDPQSDIIAYSAPIETKLPLAAGYSDGVVDPVTGAIQAWGHDESSVDVDVLNRSVGVDLGSSRQISKLELWNADAAIDPERMKFTLYSSEDNAAYSVIPRWSYRSVPVNGRMVHIFEFAGIKARYIKLHSNTSDDAASLTLIQLQKDIRAFQLTGLPNEDGNVLPSAIGYLRNDAAPGKGAVSDWGYTGEFIFDTTLNSVAADLGSESVFNQIVLYDKDNETRLRKTDLSVYVSSDNVTYTKLEDWDIKQKDYQTVLYNFSATARYVKVHQHFDIGEPTFSPRGGNLQRIMAVRNMPAGRWTFGGNEEWRFRKAVQAANTVSEAVYDRPVFISETDLSVSALIAEGKLSPTKADVRFADSTGKELHYYAADGGFYVRIPFLPAAGSTEIFMYYGNASADYVSDGLNTFQVEYGNKTVTPMPKAAGQTKSALLKDGSFLEAFNQDRNVYIRKSFDHGQTWEQKSLVADLGGTENMGSLLVLSNGDIIIPFVQIGKYQQTNCLSECWTDLYVTRSSDSGATWSVPMKINTGWGYNGTISNPIELANGDIVLPFHYVYTDDGASRVSVMYSTDRGLTWTKSASDIEISGSGYEAGATEPSVIQLSDGRLKLYFRAQTQGIYRFGESVSADNGRTWSAADDSIVYATNTLPAMMKHNDDIFLMWAGNNAFGTASYYRTPLNLAYSSDDTNSWQGYRDVMARTPYLSPEGQLLFGQPDFGMAADGSVTLSFAHKYSDWVDTRIEDFDRWLYRSSGGFSDFESPDLNNNYWWKLSNGVNVNYSRKYSGAGSLQLKDTTSYALTESTRSFGTGIRKGRVEFKLYAESLTSGFVASLKESYSHGLDAPGTMFALYAAPDGSLQYRDSSGEWTPLPAAAQLSLNEWHDIEVRFDTDANLAEIIVDGASKGNIGYYRDENIINYFHVSSESATLAGTNVYLDELIIQDTADPMPIAASVGVEESLNNEVPDDDSIAITGLPLSMLQGETGQAEVHMMQRDSSTVTVTVYSSLVSSNPDVAAVSPSGVISAMQPGNTVIEAVYGTHRASVPLTVIPSLQNLSLRSAPASMSVGSTQQLRVESVYSDGTIADITPSASYASSDPEIANVSSSGLIRALKPGLAAITVTFGERSIIHNLRVTEPEISGETSGTKPAPVPAPSDWLELSAKDLQPSSGGKISIVLPEGKLGIRLPVTAGDLTGGNSLEVVSGKIVLSLPEELLRQLADRLSIEDRNETRIQLEVRPIESKEARRIQDGIAIKEKARISFTGDLLQLTISLVMKDGSKRIVDGLETPMRIAFPIQASKNRDVLGIYSIGVDNELEFIGGTIKDGMLETELYIPGRYAVIEYDKTYEDVPAEHWAASIVRILSAKHIVEGIDELRFAPEQRVTRAEFTALLVRLLNLKTASSQTFEDIDSEAWYADSIKAAVENGLVNGIDGTHFEPERAVTREEMAVMLIRAYRYAKNMNSNDSSSTLPAYTDAQLISDWAKASVLDAAALGLLDMDGRGSGMFVPDGETNRAESAAVIYRLYTKLRD